jgi:hypothetical protein
MHDDGETNRPGGDRQTKLFSEWKMSGGVDDELHAPLEGALGPLLVLGGKHPEEV